MPALSIHLLGPLQITLDGEPISGFGSDKARALLALLAAEPGRPHRRETLAGTLWPGSPERTARTSLRQALANLRRLLRDDTQSDAPLFHITRQTIQFNASADAWVDVPRFLSLLEADHPASRPPIPQLEGAVDLYRGTFLEGFSIGDSPEFEEWALLTRERLHRLAIDALHRLAHHYLERGQYERALSYAWRQVELDPWREEAHQQVMRLLALTGRRGAALAQYQTCRQVLAQELAVEPAAETTRLYAQIRDGTLEAPPPPSTPPPDLEARRPAFLDDDAFEAPRPVFVARERELARLDGFLETTLAGQGRVAFVTGGPGRGKTALLDEFARRAMHAHPDLLVATGKCNALAGAGEPYLPFREMLAMLTGDVEARWAAGSIGRDHARRLWGALPLAAQALAERGPHITTILLDGPALLARAAAATAPLTAPWLQRLRDCIERQWTRSEGLEQSHLFEQMTNVLCRLARTHPLLLIVDDLQWTDAASTGLLFHLGRRLPGHRILLAAAYRPEEVTFGRDGGRSRERVGPAKEEDHPLGKVLAEFKGQFGDVWVDLAHSDPVQDRTFVDAFLDSEPNLLGEAFRRALFARTTGHPLFTVELLRAMQQREELLQDESGCWIQGSRLEWERLPTRVEGAIEQRIARLAPELRDLLVVASVEGEEFTAQVVAGVQGSEERQVLHCLSEDLERKHRLVRARDEVQVGERHLSRYRFGHVLFRDYLYRSLSPGERRLLHLEVGTALEALYGDQVGEIAARLAHHFAGDAMKERRYARLAGERAAAQYANEEAVRHLSRALALTPENELGERYALLLAREQVYGRQGDRQARSHDLVVLEAVAAALDDPRKQAEVALRQAEHAFDTRDYPQAVAFATAVANLGQSLGDPELEAQAYLAQGFSLIAQGEFEASERGYKQGLALAHVAGARWLEAEILRQASWVHMVRHDSRQAEARLEQSLAIFRETGDRHDEMRILYALSVVRTKQFDYQRAREDGEKGLRLCRELGAQSFEPTFLYHLTSVLEAYGEYATARDRYESVLSMARDMGYRALEPHILCEVGRMSLALGESEQALPWVQQALDIARETGDRHLEAYTLTALGQVLGALRQLEEAGTAYEQAMELGREMGQENQAMEALAGLARVRLAGGDPAWALSHVEEILSHLESGTLEGTYQPLLVYLSCYRVLQAGDDPRAETVLEEGYCLLQEIAGKFTDENLRRSFLENVEVNREIVAEYARLDQP